MAKRRDKESAFLTLVASAALTGCTGNFSNTRDAGFAASSLCECRVNSGALATDVTKWRE